MATKLPGGRRFLSCAFLKTFSTTSKPSKSSVPEVLSTHRDKRVSEIIDVRTPAEFEEDHIPGSINLPVLSNIERVTVGTLYSKSPFEARKTGAATISRNIANHIDSYFQCKPPEYSPLVYCWRGGQRSYSLALVLAQIGFQTFVLDKGYKQYRNTVKDELKILPEKFQYRVISGLTGSGKTRILDALAERGHQVLDLEGMAKHKGSVLGLWHGETQPTQKYFDSLICDRLHQLSTVQPVWMESESIRIGFVTVPQCVFNKLQTAPRYCIHLPTEERVKHIIRDYPNWIENKEQLKEIVRKLVRVRGHDLVNEWLTLIDKGHMDEFVRRILLEHYDPSYTLSQRKNNLSSVTTEDIHIPDLSEDTLDRLVHRLCSSECFDKQRLSV